MEAWNNNVFFGRLKVDVFSYQKNIFALFFYYILTRVYLFWKEVQVKIVISDNWIKKIFLTEYNVK